jgi:hypothetical protein
MSIQSFEESAKKVNEIYTKDSHKVERFFKTLVKDESIEGNVINVNTHFSIGEDYKTVIIFGNEKYFSGDNLKLIILVKKDKITFDINYPSGGFKDAPKEDILFCLNSFTSSAMAIVKAVKINPEIYTDILGCNYLLSRKQDKAYRDLELAISQNKINLFNDKLKKIQKTFSLANTQDISDILKRVVVTKLTKDQYGCSNFSTLDFLSFHSYQYNDNVMFNKFTIKISKTASDAIKYEIDNKRVAKSDLKKLLTERNIIKIGDTYPQTSQEMFILANKKLDNTKHKGVHLEMKIDPLLDLIA